LILIEGLSSEYNRSWVTAQGKEGGLAPARSCFSNFREAHTLKISYALNNFNQENNS
jgi:hypothetical protein